MDSKFGYFTLPVGAPIEISHSNVTADSEALIACVATASNDGKYTLYQCTVSSGEEPSDFVPICAVLEPICVVQHRWSQRLDQLEKSVSTLKRWEDSSADSLDELQCIGLAHCFSMAFELMWKAAKDYMEELGVHLKGTSPNSVLKQAFEVGLLPEQEVYTQMLRTRNMTCHEYGFPYLDSLISKLRTTYVPAFQEFIERLK